jgi:death-on-curing protein
LIDYLSYEDVVQVAAGIMDHVVVSDAGLLASAVLRPQVTVFGEDAYPTLADKAAALLHGIARNHALADGNKRLAWAAARVFLLMNGYSVAYDVDDAEAMVVGVAGGDVDVPQLADWLRSRMTVVA